MTKEKHNRNRNLNRICTFKIVSEIIDGSEDWPNKDSYKMKR